MELQSRNSRRVISRGWRPVGHPTRLASGLIGCRPRVYTSWETVQNVVGTASHACASEVYSSRCSIPFFETLASVIVSGIQSGLLSGADERQAQPS